MKKSNSVVFFGLGLFFVLSLIVTLVFEKTPIWSGGFGLTRIGFFVQIALAVACIVLGFLQSQNGGAARFFTGRAATFGLFTLVSALLLVVILAAANFVAYKKPKAWDLTKNKIYTLSEDTTQVLGKLGADVTVRAFYSQAEPPYAETDDLLRRYAGISSHFKYEMIDPAKSPELVESYHLVAGGDRIVLSSGKGETRASAPTEEAITNALVKLTRTGERKVYFVEGHGEPDPKGQAEDGYEQVVKALDGEGFKVENLSLADAGQVPKDAAVVVVAGPRTSILDREVAGLRKYLEIGGHLAIFLEPQQNTGLDDLLKDWGIKADDDLVLDMSLEAQMGGGAGMPVIAPSPDHDATRALARYRVGWPTVRSLDLVAGAKVTPVVIASSGRSSWGETDFAALAAHKEVRFDQGKERMGPLPVAMAVSQGVPSTTAGAAERVSDMTRLIVAGDSQFFSNGYLSIQKNRDFFLNTLNWLAGQGDRLTIRPRMREAPRVFLTEAQIANMRFLTRNALPLVLLGLGLAVWLVRRGK